MSQDMHNLFYMCLIASVIILDYSHTCKNQSSIIILKYIKDISDKIWYFYQVINVDRLTNTFFPCAISKSYGF